MADLQEAVSRVMLAQHAVFVCMVASNLCEPLRCLVSDSLSCLGMFVREITHQHALQEVQQHTKRGEAEAKRVRQSIADLQEAVFRSCVSGKLAAWNSEAALAKELRLLGCASC